MVLHIKITHYNDDLVLSSPMSQVLHFGCKCRKYYTVILLMLCLEQHYQEHLQDTSKDWF
jgi:hypothetical protein